MTTALKNGAFVFLDCLGFKGVWNRGVTPEQILEFLKSAKADAHKSSWTQFVLQRFPNIEQSVVFVSDSIAISTTFKTPPKDSEIAFGYLVTSSISLTTELFKRFVEGPVPLMFRGCITTGPHIAEESFILGPAADEAASLAQSTNGAFVWLTPSAQSWHRKFLAFERKTAESSAKSVDPKMATEFMDRAVSDRQKRSDAPPKVQRLDRWWKLLTLEQKGKVALRIMTSAMLKPRDDRVLRDYPMDLKGGGHLTADVVNPLSSIAPSAYRRWIDRALSGFTNAPIDVLRKRQNTERLLNAALRASEDGDQVLGQAVGHIEAELEAIAGVPFSAADTPRTAL